MKRWQYLFSVQLNFNKLSSTEKPDKSNYDRLVYKPTVTTHELCMDGVYAIYLSLFWEYRLFKGQIIVQFIFGCCYIYFIFYILYILNKGKTAKKEEKRRERERDKDTLCYFTPRTDGSHTPQCLLEGCIDMETAITIGQVLQETDVSHVWTIYWHTTLKYIQKVFPNQKHQLDSRKSKSVLIHEIMWLFRYFHSTGLEVQFYIL